jgi:N-acetylglucosaminyl-diphospho-decaprenol L-rhamnosyltransferase
VTGFAVITVLYRSDQAVLAWADALQRARAAVKATHHVDVIAVDNASGDGTAGRVRARAPWITVLEQPENRGFAAGCNVGLGAVADSTSIVVLLNPDVLVPEDFFVRLATLRWPREVGAIGPRVLTPQGAIEQSARAFPTLLTGTFGRTSLLSRLFPTNHLTRSQLLADPEGGPRTVDWISGACLIAPADCFTRVGRLDEGYWMYWEDADWCRRAHDLGMRIEYRPELVVTHRQGSSSRLRPWRTTVAFHRSAARYYCRHVARSPLEAGLATALLAGRLALKLAAAAGRRVAAGRAASPRRDTDG